MFTHRSYSFHLHSIVISLHLLFKLPCHHARDFKSYYTNCSKNFSCGERVREIGYPFWGGERPEYCGLPGLKLGCRDDKHPELDTGLGYKFEVVDINQMSHGIYMRREKLGVDSCPSKIFNTTFNNSIFEYRSQTEDLHMFYDCSNDTKIEPENQSSRDSLTCTSSDLGPRNVVYFGNDSFPVYHFDALKSCNSRLIVQVNKSVLEDFNKNVTKKVEELLNPSFVVYYKINDVACDACKSWGGLCWSGIGIKEFTCLCHDGAYDQPCPKPGAFIIFFYYTSFFSSM
ncbi:hypothetical protein POM88_016135 [Heracleum sosnowskyi]|uniref:non-specific serine/threonine protein kinase n=1 Tax=Heracleum sosnowskyi TaxID=360622 RepID=A0AAD8IP74_9APIA|nr:hypothetical protein POM88_016135 [Heracleum sosnowskyi]